LILPHIVRGVSVQVRVCAFLLVLRSSQARNRMRSHPQASDSEQILSVRRARLPVQSRLPVRRGRQVACEERPGTLRTRMALVQGGALCRRDGRPRHRPRRLRHPAAAVHRRRPALELRVSVANRLMCTLAGMPSYHDGALVRLAKGKHVDAARPLPEVVLLPHALSQPSTHLAASPRLPTVTVTVTVTKPSFVRRPRTMSRHDGALVRLAKRKHVDADGHFQSSSFPFMPFLSPPHTSPPPSPALSQPQRFFFVGLFL
jgi:hypothetical protein